MPDFSSYEKGNTCFNKITKKKEKKLSSMCDGKMTAMTDFQLNPLIPLITYISISCAISYTSTLQKHFFPLAMYMNVIRIPQYGIFIRTSFHVLDSHAASMLSIRCHKFCKQIYLIDSDTAFKIQLKK